MIPTTRAEFKDYCYRALGSPVLQINIDDDQADDRIDEALYLYQQFHMDAVVKNYLQHEITASRFTFAAEISGEFANGEVITGATSGARGEVTTQSNTTSITFFTMSGDFANGEVITGATSAATGTVASITLGDMDNRYFDINDSTIVAITRMFPAFDGRLYTDVLFDPYAQFNMSVMSSFTNGGMIPYVMGRQYQQLVSDTFRGRPQIRFQRHQGRIYVDINMRSTFRPGHFIILECYQALDPETYESVWSDRWLQRYTIALLKRQWGMNLSKYNGIQLPGGVTLDGRSMLTEANQEVRDLEAELQSTHTLPPEFFIG